MLSRSMTFSVVDILYAICSDSTKEYGGRKWPKMESIARSIVVVRLLRRKVALPSSFPCRWRLKCVAGATGKAPNRVEGDPDD